MSICLFASSLHQNFGRGIVSSARHRADLVVHGGEQVDGGEARHGVGGGLDHPELVLRQGLEKLAGFIIIMGVSIAGEEGEEDLHIEINVSDKLVLLFSKYFTNACFLDLSRLISVFSNDSPHTKSE